MTKVHTIKDYGHEANENHIFKNTEGENNSICIVEEVFKTASTNISEIDIERVDSNESRTHSNTDVVTLLELETIRHESKAKLRNILFKKILSNEADKLSLLKFGLVILGTILVSTVSTFPFTLIPIHNVILYPGYWYEVLFLFPKWFIWLAIYYIYVPGFYLNIVYIKRFRHILVIFLSLTLTSFVVIPVGYCVWTYVLHLQYPIPWSGYTLSYCILFVALVTLWFRFPKEWRNNSSFESRLKYVISLQVYSLVVGIQYEFASMLLIKYQNIYQPILALLFIVIREVNSWIYSKFISKIASGDESSAQHVGSSTVVIKHMVMMCYIVGLYATLESSTVLIGIDSAYNIYLSFRIVWLQKQRPADIEKQINLLQELARNELVEFMTPLAFLVAFVVAYYGPNSDLFGNVCAEIWQYVAIEDINGTVKSLFMLFFIDFCSTVLSGIILWIYCKINLLKVLTALEMEYGLAFCVLIGLYTSTVSR